MDLQLAPGILEAAINDANRNYPREGCGLISGQQPGVGTRFIPTDNAKAGENAYFMDPAKLIDVLRELRTAGEQLVAIYHSHPRGPARPSTSDIEEAYYPEAAHLIVSLQARERPQVAAFRIMEGRVLEIEVHVIV